MKHEAFNDPHVIKLSNHYYLKYGGMIDLRFIKAYVVLGLTLHRNIDAYNKYLDTIFEKELNRIKLKKGTKTLVHVKEKINMKTMPLFIYINNEGDYIESSMKLNLNNELEKKAAYGMLTADGQLLNIYDEGDNILHTIKAEEETHFNYSAYELESNYEEAK